MFSRGIKNGKPGIFSEKDPINLNILGIEEENLLLKVVLKITLWKLLDRDERKMEWKREKNFAWKSEQLITEIIAVGTAIYLGTSSSKKKSRKCFSTECSFI